MSILGFITLLRIYSSILGTLYLLYIKVSLQRDEFQSIYHAIGGVGGGGQKFKFRSVPLIGGGVGVDRNSMPARVRVLPISRCSTEGAQK